MKAITIKSQKNREERSLKIANPFKLLLATYLAYVASRDKEKIYWYVKAVIVIPCVVMVPTIILMRYATPHFVWFNGLCVIMFYVNVMVHIAQLKSNIYIPVYHATIALMILIPTITYILSI